MSQPDLDEARIEEIKTKIEFDEKVAAKYGVPKGKVKKDHDPTLVKLILEFLRRRR